MKRLIYIVFLMLIISSSTCFAADNNRWVRLFDDSPVSVDSQNTKYLGENFYSVVAKLDYDIMRTNNEPVPSNLNDISFMIMTFSFDTERKMYQIERILTFDRNNKLIGDAKRPPNADEWKPYVNGGGRALEVLAIAFGCVLYPQIKEAAPEF